MRHIRTSLDELRKGVGGEVMQPRHSDDNNHDFPRRTASTSHN